MSITATFSNGKTKTYGGSRDVNAAWAIFEDDKIIDIGFSMNRKLATSTPSSKISSRLGHYISSGNSMGSHRCNYNTAKKLGWDGKGNAKRYIKGINTDLRIEYDKNHRIEVVDVDVE